MYGNRSENRATLEARKTRNMSVQAQNREIEKRNESFLSRRLTKAFGPVVAWFGVLLTFFTLIERFEREEKYESPREG